MPVLALDTSSAVSVAVVEDDVPGGVPLRRGDGVLAARRVLEQRRHAELLAPLVVEVLALSGVDRRDLTAVVVGTGPAPFTGLRAGLVTARTFAMALGIPVHGVSSLDALAAEAASELGLPSGSTVLVATDARRHEVYWARYRVAWGGAHASDPSSSDVGEDLVGTWPAGPPVVLVDGPGVARPAELAAELAGMPRDDVVVGGGAALYGELGALVPPGATSIGTEGPDPSFLARLALARLADGEASLPTAPLYLRRPDVVPPTARKRVIG